MSIRCLFCAKSKKKCETKCNFKSVAESKGFTVAEFDPVFTLFGVKFVKCVFANAIKHLKPSNSEISVELLKVKGGLIWEASKWEDDKLGGPYAFYKSKASASEDEPAEDLQIQPLIEAMNTSLKDNVNRFLGHGRTESELESIRDSINWEIRAWAEYPIGGPLVKIPVDVAPLDEGEKVLGNDSGDPRIASTIKHEEQARDYGGTPHVPIYVELSQGTINASCKLVDAEILKEQLKMLKGINVDGVVVNCLWGIVEAQSPHQYTWSDYRELFGIVKDLDLKLKVVMCFHACGNKPGENWSFGLPAWVMKIGTENPDIFFTDKDENRIKQCLSWGIDKQRVLKDRNALEVYSDFMRSFRTEFDEFFKAGLITKIIIGELYYPSHYVSDWTVWDTHGIGEFQCYDKYLKESLKEAAKARGHPIWGRAPTNAGYYNSKPQDTGFFRDGGDYESFYGRFFLKWYCNILLDHLDSILAMASITFETNIVVKFPCIYWWYRTSSHAAELTAGFNNSSNRDGYAPIACLLKKHKATLSFSGADLSTQELVDHTFSDVLPDPQALMWQVLNDAWDADIPVEIYNFYPCYGKEGYDMILQNAKPINNPDGKHVSAFTYLSLTPELFKNQNLEEFDRFIKKMHGDEVEEEIQE